MQKICYQLDEWGFYQCDALADESPEEPGVFHLPGGCVWIAPPEHKDEHFRRFDREAQTWGYEYVPPPPAPDPDTSHHASILAMYRMDVQTRLDKSDRTIARCFEDGITVPQEWREYRTALRLLMRSMSTDPIPDTPPFPEA
jgi:hypothetical protein